MTKMKVSCINHPDYNHVSQPELSCHICCALYMKRVRAERAQETTDRWLSKKIKRKDR
jgi:hypothetical protein